MKDINIFSATSARGVEANHTGASNMTPKELLALMLFSQVHIVHIIRSISIAKFRVHIITTKVKGLFFLLCGSQVHF